MSFRNKVIVDNHIKDTKVHFRQPVKMPEPEQFKSLEETREYLRKKVDSSKAAPVKAAKGNAWNEEILYTKIQQDGESGRAYAAGPKMMSLVLKEYALAEKMIEEEKWTCWMDDRAYDFLFDMSKGAKGDCFCTVRKITMTQLVFNDPDIPVSLLKQLLSFMFPCVMERDNPNMRPAVTFLQFDEIFARELFEDPVDERAERFFPTSLKLDYARGEGTGGAKERERRRKRCARSIQCIRRIVACQEDVMEHITFSSIFDDGMIGKDLLPCVFPLLPELLDCFPERSELLIAWAKEIRSVVSDSGREQRWGFHDKDCRMPYTKKGFSIIRKLGEKFRGCTEAEQIYAAMLFSYLYELKHSCTLKKTKADYGEAVELLKTTLRQSGTDQRFLFEIFWEVALADSFYEDSSKLWAYQEIFGKKPEILLDSAWLDEFQTYRFSQVSFDDEEDSNDGLFEMLFQWAGAFRHPERIRSERTKYLRLCRQLVHIDQEELFRDGLKKGFLEEKDLKKLLSYAISTGCENLSPYMIYLVHCTKAKGQKDRKSQKGTI